MTQKVGTSIDTLQVRAASRRAGFNLGTLLKITAACVIGYNFVKPDYDVVNLQQILPNDNNVYAVNSADYDGKILSYATLADAHITFISGTPTYNYDTGQVTISGTVNNVDCPLYGVFANQDNMSYSCFHRTINNATVRLQEDKHATIESALSGAS